MRDYARLSPRFWTGSTGKALRQLGANAQVVALYLVSSPSSNMIGLYYLPVPAICHETGIAEDAVLEALEGIRAVGFAFYDFETSNVFLPEMARWQVAETLQHNDNRRIAVVRELEAAYASCPLFAPLFAEKYQESFNLGAAVYPKGASHERIPGPIVRAVWERDEGLCKGCGRGPEGVEEGINAPFRGLHLDHVLAKINGGTTCVENLQLLCNPCNSKKSAEDRKLFWENALGGVLVSLQESKPEGVRKGSGRGPEGVRPPLRSQEQEQEQDKEQKAEEKSSCPTATPSDATARPVNGHAKVYPADFMAFYAPYPKKEAKDDALKAWKATAGARPPIEEIVAAIEAQKKSDNWRKDGGKFIPLPATWLRAGRWADSLGIEGVQLLPLERPRQAPSFPEGRHYAKL